MNIEQVRVQLSHESHNTKSSPSQFVRHSAPADNKYNAVITNRKASCFAVQRNSNLNNNKPYEHINDNIYNSTYIILLLSLTCVYTFFLISRVMFTQVCLESGEEQGEQRGLAGSE